MQTYEPTERELKQQYPTTLEATMSCGASLFLLIMAAIEEEAPSPKRIVELEQSALDRASNRWGVHAQLLAS